MKLSAIAYCHKSTTTGHECGVHDHCRLVDAKDIRYCDFDSQLELHSSRVCNESYSIHVLDGRDDRER